MSACAHIIVEKKINQEKLTKKAFALVVNRLLPQFRPSAEDVEISVGADYTECEWRNEDLIAHAIVRGRFFHNDATSERATVYVYMVIAGGLALEKNKYYILSNICQCYREMRKEEG